LSSPCWGRSRLMADCSCPADSMQRSAVCQEKSHPEPRSIHEAAGDDVRSLLYSANERNNQRLLTSSPTILGNGSLPTQADSRVDFRRARKSGAGRSKDTTASISSSTALSSSSWLQPKTAIRFLSGRLQERIRRHSSSSPELRPVQSAINPENWKYGAWSA